MATPTRNLNGNYFSMENLIHSTGLPLSLTHSFGKWTGWWLHRAGGHWWPASFWKTGKLFPGNGYFQGKLRIYSSFETFPASFHHLTQTATLPQYSSPWQLAPRYGNYTHREQSPTTRVRSIAAFSRSSLAFPYFSSRFCHYQFILSKYFGASIFY